MKQDKRFDYKEAEESRKKFVRYKDGCKVYKLFVAMPAYKTKQVDEQRKAIYQDVAYPVTKEFREKLYGNIIEEYNKAKTQTQNQNQAHEKAAQTPSRPLEREATPFR